MVLIAFLTLTTLQNVGFFSVLYNKYIVYKNTRGATLPLDLRQEKAALTRRTRDKKLWFPELRWLGRILGFIRYFGFIKDSGSLKSYSILGL